MKRTDKVKRVAKNFLVYWRPSTVEDEFRLGIALDHAGSEQFGERIQPGDTLWIVTARYGELFLLGRLIIAAGPMSRDEAIKHLDRRHVWNSTHHVIADPATVAPLQQIALGGIAGDLTFRSTRAPRLKLRRGKVNPQSLQTMRELTAESVALLSDVWHHPGQVRAR